MRSNEWQIGFGSIFLAVGVIFGCLLGLSNSELTPPYFNLATGRQIYATATCGVGTDGPELYCKLTGANTENDRDFYSVIQGQVCDVCNPSIPDKHHPPENAIDGKESWWQSPPLSRGMKYNEVNLTIDFGQEFHVAYLFIRMGNSPRPGLWTLEKSSDYGKTWTAWQHFSDTPSDCETYFGKESLYPITNDNDVICTTEYSKIVPLENGEIPVMLLNNRPSANNYFNSSVLQEWTRATNVRIRLLRTKNLLGHLMSVARQDHTVTRRYFYSIKDISIGGRCMCNGHADTCDVLDPKSARRILACRCQHRTCGIQCNECCPGFEQKKWRQNTKARPFNCEPCNCFGHSNLCIYDEETDRKGLSLDIHGNYEGGGVCQNCQHNTEGINCNQCKSKYYRPYGKHWNETDVCKACNCEFFYSTGNCAEETGRCECRKEFQPPYCDSCAYGYFGFPNCRECECNLNGTDGYHCEARNGECPCKPNFAGHYCKECAEGFYNYPECKACECNTVGSISNDCDFESGQCKCLSNFGGKNCERCKDGYYSYPTCKYCDCDLRGTESDICDKETGKCLCQEGYGGPRCDQCLPGYYNYPDCMPCNCSTLGSTSKTCDVTGKCLCLHNFAGKQCNHCSAGYFSYPECLPCNCNTHGTEGISCNADGQCLCHPNFDGKTCDACKEGFYNFPACEECNCDPAGVIAKFAGCGSVPAGELCQCKERVTGRICDQCKPLYWNLNITNPEGCEVCDCYLDGTIGSLDTCDTKSGQCACKPSVESRQCKDCRDGSYDLFGGSLFGCKDCSCDIGGSRSYVCNKISGQCLCHPRVTGRKCTQPLTTHYFPTLYQFQFEYEDGYTPSRTQVRYQYAEEDFPGFSGKGYAVFSDIQNEVINEVTVFKSSVYQLVIRYVNPTNKNITANILITSDNTLEVDQTAKVLFKPTTSPQFVTVSGPKGLKPSPIVLDPDPGRYTISIKTDKHVLLDYFVLLPAAYYEASILTRKIENPCELGNLDLCRHYKYPSVAEFKPSFDPYIFENDVALGPVENYGDTEHLSIIEYPKNVSLVTDSQRSLKFFADITHTGRYIVVIDYITDRALPETYTVKVRVPEMESDFGAATLYPCLYTTPCRQPVIDEESREKVFFLDLNQLRIIEIYHDHEDFGRVGIISVTAIPVEQWSVDYIRPSPVCVMQDLKCVNSTFRIVPDSKKIEVEHDHDQRIVTFMPPYVAIDDSLKLIYLDHRNASIEIRSNITTPGRYVIIVKYYQPNHPNFTIPFRLEAGKQLYEGRFEVMHCPSSSGCRGIIRPDHGAATLWFDIENEFKFTLTNNRPKGVWLDYIMVVPVDQYHDFLLEEETFDQTKEFIKKCGQDHFYIPLNVSDFCKKAVFSLTADYNNGALPCHCDYEGSTSFECDPFGGQCQCKPNVIGRKCDACRTGYYGFPECKLCDCPQTAICEKDTGVCVCPPYVTGEQCDQCEPYTFGFHQLLGCEECNCSRLGVHNGNLQCDLHSGACECRTNIEGRSCDQCSNGFFNFPHCDLCGCNSAGTTYEICDKVDERCFCKPNVVGRRCDMCDDGTYNLQASNPDGCTKCFCFGKTTRCESAFLRLFNVSMMRNTSINDVWFKEEMTSVPWYVSAEDYVVNETTIQADFSLKEEDDAFVYFRVLDYLLNQNNHLTSYGGHLVYTLYYTTGPFGKAILAPDVILEGKHNVLFHQSYEQPASAQNFRGSVKIIESNFQTYDKKPVTRAEFMMVLRDLKGIYIRASYWDPTVLSLLSDVYLSMADEDQENYNMYQELPVEKCFCPAGYTGFSCEDCAPGYYRDPDGPNGGYCIPCQCNGHADTCDCNTGICKNCQHFTTGDHCEMCIEGYHGNATYGTPHDCMICACPLPYDYNNFATSCEISEAGNEIHCECRTGYTGARCESCASGFYGQPEKLGDFCKPCECSGNINPEEVGACDTITGECLMCLNNTYGRACNLCAPGFYGDAIKLKDCKTCDCEEFGTLECDSYVGTCVCHDNVIGMRCDMCEPDHYGYDSGTGCRPCDCGIASNSSQCNDHTGDCACKPGVTGRQCDRCAVDHWNYTSDGCVPCRCNKGYSRGFGCNTQTGQCECLPGVIGEKCDACPHRWVLIKDEGCNECDPCHHALLNVTDRFRDQLAPIIGDFQSVALAYFTDQKLNYYNKLADDIAPSVKALDPKGVNLNPSRQEIESLEMDSKNLAKKVSYAEQSAKDSCANGNKLLFDASDMLDQSRLVNSNVKNTIMEVEHLSRSFDTSVNTIAENAIAEAEGIIKQLENIDIDLGPSTEQHNKSTKLLYEIELFTLPVKRQQESLVMLKTEIGQFSDKLEDLHKWSIAAINKSQEVDNLNQKNKEEFKNSKFDTVANLTRETETHLKDIGKILINGDLIIDAINRNVEMLNDTAAELKATNSHLNELLLNADDEHQEIQDLLDLAVNRAQNLMQMADELAKQYSNVTSNSEEPIKAATAYSKIVEAVKGAKNAVKNAKYAAGNATQLGDGVRERAGIADRDARELLHNGRQALMTVQEELQPHLNRSGEIVKTISGLNKKSEEKLAEINSALEQIPNQSQRMLWENANDNASDAIIDAKDALQILTPVVQQAPIDLGVARNMSKHVEVTNKDIVQTTHQVDRAKDLVPKIQELIDTLSDKQNKTSATGATLGDQIERLKRQIEMAREIANSIKVGVTFRPTTVLELKAPETLPLLGTSSKVSAFFNTSQETGFLFYLGNENKTGTGRGQNADFMALEIVNGYPVLTIDLGNGPEKLVNPKYVSDGTWYQAIVERTGNNAKLIIREELAGGEEKLHEVEQPLPGPYSVFNVDKNSRLFVGGYSPDFNPPEDITYSSFEGQIEELKIGDEEVGLWNFVDGQDNTQGAKFRDKLTSQKVSATGYRFNGNGYVVLDAKPYSFKLRSSIHFRFKASKDTKDGLMFYAGRHRHFISVELKDGGVFFQYKLGQHVVSIGTQNSFNDDQWHKVEAERDGRKGLLKVDGKVVYQEESRGTEENLKISDEMYFGGYPGKINHSEVVSKNFNGCIDDVTVAGRNVDLSRHLKAIGIRAGCPEKFATVLSYPPREFGYLKKPNVTSENSFHINLKFKTRQRDGVIFYATNYDQSSSIGLTIENGTLNLRSMMNEISSGLKRYNDGEWHVVTVTHDRGRLRMAVDDSEDYISPYVPPALIISLGDIYFGGLPMNYWPLKGALSNTAYFAGCISDVTLNNQIVNFANITDRMSGNLDSCPSDILDYDVSAVPLYYPGDEVEIIHTERPIPGVYETSRPLPPPDEIATPKEPEVIITTPAYVVPPFIPETTTPPRTPTTTLAPDPTTMPPTIPQTPSTKKPRPPRPPRPPPEPSDAICALPIDPEYDVDYDAGYRFIGARGKRLEVNQIPSKMKRSYDIVLEFKAENGSGLLLYAADARHTDFIALYLNNGYLHHSFRSGRASANIISNERYNDGNWHRVEFIRNQHKGALIVDEKDQKEEDLDDNSRVVSLQAPIFIGGVDVKHEDDLLVNVNLEKGTYFKGCIKGIQMGKRPVMLPSNTDIPPCSDQIESGVFFGKGGGHVRLRDSFHVGTELAITFDFKPRTSNGLLFSVHGKHAYLIIQLYNGTIVFNVKNDEKNMIEATFKPEPGESFCDGKWRTVQAIKSQYVITLTVDSVSSMPAIGMTTKPSTDTTRPLFMGGHPYMERFPPGLKTQKPYHGCIRNLKLRGKQPEQIAQDRARGDVWVGTCPTV